MAIEKSHRPIVLDLVRTLIAQDFSVLQEDGRIGRLTAGELRDAIEQYGRSLVDIPDAGWDLAESYEIDGQPGSWGIDLPMWTEEEGRSDLTLSLSITRGDDGKLAVEIDDLHVL